ncbi:MAG: tRNA (adenosine(37)-N6)-threonylcarbamoyltransferase complex transferase subunit TsaD [Cytophagales bacterium]
MSNYILAIESSCDDTGAAVIHNGKILTNIVSSQKIHEQYGGVVPELASRDHQKNIVPVVSQALLHANIQKNQLKAVAYTRGPGLLGSLLVGSCFAKSLALSLNIPTIEVHHMRAHILAHFIEDRKPNFPFLCLTVSGGHTQIVKVDSPLEMTVVGETQDDAVGEAFDKTAKLLGIPYPGGPLLDKLAQSGNENAFEFPQVEMVGYNFSFSGIKTAILYFLQKNIKTNPQFIEQNLNDICASVQATLIEILLKKLRRASRELKIKEIAIAGGVSANSKLRTQLLTEAEIHAWNVYIPKFEYCTDNAAMIAMAAHFQFEKEIWGSLLSSPLPRWDM